MTQSISTRNNVATDTVKNFLKRRELGYSKLYREKRLTVGVDGYGIKFYGINGWGKKNSHELLLAELNNQLKVCGCVAVIEKQRPDKWNPTTSLFVHNL